MSPHEKFVIDAAGSRIFDCLVDLEQQWEKGAAASRKCDSP
jgi:hypothetical protein